MKEKFLEDVAPQGHAVIVAGKKGGFRVSLVAENITFLQDSKQTFSRRETAMANIREVVKMCGGRKILVLDTTNRAAFWLTPTDVKLYTGVITNVWENLAKRGYK